MKHALRDIGEAGVLALVTRILGQDGLPPDWIGPGDDAAVTSLPAGTHVLTTSDILVEEIHFRRHTTSPEDLGWKSLAVNVSDIHSMGGVPAWAIVSIALAADTPVAWLEALYRGLADAARTYGLPIVGGDTSGSPGPAVISITVVGHTDRPRLRSDARPGDVLVASGPFGLSRAGLWALEHPRAPLAAEVRAEAERAHTRPELPGPPRELAGLPRFAMLDDSDGLGASCRLLAESSGVAVRLEAEQIPFDAVVAAIAAEADVDPLIWQLWGGEDYGLVAAIPPDAPVPAGWAVLGGVASGSGAWLSRTDGALQELVGEAFEHFGS